MKNFWEQAKKKIMIFDGSMGSMILKYNPRPADFGGHDGCTDYLSISQPDIIQNIHEEYLRAGCDIIETNTFGANAIALKDYKLADRAYAINKAAARLARSAATKYSTADQPRYVSGSIGPGTKLPSLGQIKFDELRLAYERQALGLIDGGADILQIETCQDLLQIKAALAGAQTALKKRNKKLPLIAQATIESNGKMLMGTDISAVIAALEPYPLFALGLNCSTGPKEMVPHVQALSEYSPFHISVLPNAGIPEAIRGKTKYKLTPGELADYHKLFIQRYGVTMVGGCCGTTPAHIKEVVRVCAKLTAKKRRISTPARLASLYSAVEIGVKPKPFIVGERTNATGNKSFRDQLLAEDMDGLVETALEQEHRQAHCVDVSVAYAGRDEARDMTGLLERLNTALKIPIMIDTTNIGTMEESLKKIAGRAIINSANLEQGERRAKKIFRLARQYGAAVVCLTIDEQGMAKTAARKIQIAKRLFKLAVIKCGLRPHDLFFDPLTFTLASGDKELYGAGRETLLAIRRLKKKFPRSFTLLGVSNISFGLDSNARAALNSVFLAEAVKAGLDAAIIHAGKILPLYKLPRARVKLCQDLIFNKRTTKRDPLTEIIKYFAGEKTGSSNKEEWQMLSPEEKLRRHIIDGRKADLENTLQQALERYAPLRIINELLLPAMEEVGCLFEAGKTQLPFVLLSAETMKKAVACLEPRLGKGGGQSRGTILLATVRGDVHDIGKNLVDIILSNNGYRVINLGIDQSAQDILKALKGDRVDCIGLSGLLVKSTNIMKEYLETFNRYGIKIPVVCGGAALTENYYKKELKPAYKGKAYWGKDAFSILKIMRRR